MNAAQEGSQAVREIRQPGAYRYVFGKYAEPIATVEPGERIAIYTDDAFNGQIRTAADHPSRVLTGLPNPQTGPLYIAGSEPGDTLIVDLHAIAPTRGWAASALVPYFGGLTSTDLKRSLQEPLPEKVWIYELRDGVFYYQDKFAIPWRPFTGTMWTASALEAISSLTPGRHGGNMDVPEVRPGNRMFFPVAVPGAYFYTGDCHGAQGLVLPTDAGDNSCAPCWLVMRRLEPLRSVSTDRRGGNKRIVDVQSATPAPRRYSYPAWTQG